MRKGTARSAGSARHQQFRARAKTRVDDLQDMFSGLQYARKEARSTDAVLLEAQLHQMLREWRAELSVPSPASSLQAVRSHFNLRFVCAVFVLLVFDWVAVVDGTAGEQPGPVGSAVRDTAAAGRGGGRRHQQARRAAAPAVR